MITTINPATEQILSRYSFHSPEQVLNYVQKSHMAFESWKDLSIIERGEFFVRLAAVLREHKQKYATLITNEMGKPIKESLSEIEKCAILCESLVTKAPLWLSDQLVSADGFEHRITFAPLGPIYIIMPWNFPFWQPMKVALPHLIAGNTILLKHARNVTGSALAIQDAFVKAGFPLGVFTTLVIDHETSNKIIESDIIQGVSFTGSVEAGSKIAAHAGRFIKKLVLELGGSDPHIVLADADIDRAVQGAVVGRTLNAGQVCIGSKRIIVESKIAAEFQEKFTLAISKLKVGDPLDPTTDIGPLVDQRAVEDMQAFVTDALLKGGVATTGGRRRAGPGFFFEPTVLADTTLEMNAVYQEVFGPIAPIIVVGSAEEAIRVANDSEFGLSASIWSLDVARAQRLARQINAGAVFINSISKSNVLLPIGGIKKSGYGRELSEYGIKEFVNIKAINTY